MLQKRIMHQIPITIYIKLSISSLNQEKDQRLLELELRSLTKDFRQHVFLQDIKLKKLELKHTYQYLYLKVINFILWMLKIMSK
jgi:hypothetical protein